MIINYGINRRRPGSKRKRDIECKNETLEIDGIDFDDNEVHKRIRAEIRGKHPGWSLTGYALDRSKPL